MNIFKNQQIIGLLKIKMSDEERDKVFGQLLNGAGIICRLGFCEKAEIIFPLFGIDIRFNDDESWKGLSIKYELTVSNDDN